MSRLCSREIISAVWPPEPRMTRRRVGLPGDRETGVSFPGRRLRIRKRIAVMRRRMRPKTKAITSVFDGMAGKRNQCLT